MIISEITRDSIDKLKANFKDDMEKSDWMLIINHMKKLGISKPKQSKNWKFYLII